jgi:hypothetical protein
VCRRHVTNRSLVSASSGNAGHVEATRTIRFRIDATPPGLAGLPVAGCTIWPPSNQLVQVANVVATDSGSGVAPDSLLVEGVSNEPLMASDIVIHGGEVSVRASRSGKLEGRSYTIAARATDLAGNVATASGVCVVPHDRSVNPELK